MAPWGIVNGPADTSTLVGSLLVTVTATGAAAGDGREIASVPDVPNGTDVLAGTVIVPALCTVDVSRSVRDIR